MTIKKISLLYNTVKYLKPIQIRYRVYYALRKKLRNLTGFAYPLSMPSDSESLKLLGGIAAPKSYEAENRFTFLNLTHRFENRIDWNFKKYGKLWTYNLNYFDFLNQDGMDIKDGLRLIRDYIESLSYIEDGLEPFPVSLRGINWIKFLSRHKIDDPNIDSSLYAQYCILMDNIEYHLLGNHLLENGFSLLYGAYYFKDEKFYEKAKEILEKELQEQILSDGAHFELSPMYHQLMLYRVLECINLMKNNRFKEEDILLALFNEKAAVMAGWMKKMTFSNGDIPLLNDSALGIAPTSFQLLQYASTLNLLPKKMELSDSGYRIWKNEKYEIVVDIGKIGPDYIPGHAHSDTFTFLLYKNGEPLIVDTGISTYEPNERRQKERGTAAHNTVMVEGLEQSEVWGAFRVADRAYVYETEESENTITARHDAYKKRLDATHERKFVFNEKSIRISDKIISKKSYRGEFFIHFHPNIKLSVDKNRIFCNNAQITVKGADITLSDYMYAPEFNNLKNAKMVKLSFKNSMEIEIAL